MCTKSPTYIKCVATLPCEMQMSENGTNGAKNSIKSCHVKVSHNFNQLLMLSQNLLKTSSFDLHTSSRCVCQSLIAGRVLYPSAGQRSPTKCSQHCVVTRAGNTTPEFVAPHQTAYTSIWWHTVTLPVASPITCLTVVC